MSKSIAYRHYIRALSRWPKDNLRPECQFQDVMRRRINKKLLPASGPGTPGGAQPMAVDEKAELEQVNVLYSLLANKYSQMYPITGNLMTPKSDPAHYTDLVKELEVAPERSWWGRLQNRMKGILRFS